MSVRHEAQRHEVCGSVGSRDECSASHPGANWTGGWVGSRVGLNDAGKRQVSVMVIEPRYRGCPVRIQTELSLLLAISGPGLKECQ